MSLSKEKTQAVIKKFGKTETDTGSASVQIALLTERLSLIHISEPTRPY